MAHADVGTGEGPLLDRVLGKAAGKDRRLNACGLPSLRWCSAATQLEEASDFQALVGNAESQSLSLRDTGIQESALTNSPDELMQVPSELHWGVRSWNTLVRTGQGGGCGRWRDRGTKKGQRGRLGDWAKEFQPLELGLR